jgi:hypothetical protein
LQIGDISARLNAHVRKVGRVLTLRPSEVLALSCDVLSGSCSKVGKVRPELRLKPRKVLSLTSDALRSPRPKIRKVRPQARQDVRARSRCTQPNPSEVAQVPNLLLKPLSRETLTESHQLLLYSAAS